MINFVLKIMFYIFNEDLKKDVESIKKIKYIDKVKISNDLFLIKINNSDYLYESENWRDLDYLNLIKKLKFLNLC